jgi:hypothetical protein
MSNSPSPPLGGQTPPDPEKLGRFPGPTSYPGPSAYPGRGMKESNEDTHHHSGRS